ncbi:MAG TPA: hypothetical protein VE988_20580 [Gemmataceae bacterium]|nr:hypothetical protein [Gemmataceae bacterium]
MASQGVSPSNFGLFIAYVLPGFTAMQGLPFLSSPKSGWGAAQEQVAITLPSFLSGMTEAVAVGLIVSTVRWLVIDTLHHRTGLKQPRWDFALLEKNVAAFEFLIDIHYRYYKFYANMVVALLWAYATGGYALGWRGLVYWLLAALCLFASRDCLGKYYGRSGQLLGDSGHKRRTVKAALS